MPTSDLPYERKIIQLHAQIEKEKKNQTSASIIKQFPIFVKVTW